MTSFNLCLLVLKYCRAKKNYVDDIKKQGTDRSTKRIKVFSYLPTGDNDVSLPR